MDAMKIITIRRFPEIPDGVPGVLFDENIPFAVTMEPKNCIPLGEYLCKRFKSEKHPNTFEITGVAGRTFILFHKGNIAATDSLGCILVAEKFGNIAGVTAIQESEEGFNEFLRRTDGMDAFKLVVMKS